MTPGAPLDRDTHNQQPLIWARQQAAACVQAGDFAGARRWLDRALRLSPTHDPLAVERATLLLRLDPAEALAAFEPLAERHQAGGLLVGAATAALLSGATGAALGWLQALLSGHAFEAGWDQLASRIVLAAGCPGWCGLASEGRLVLPDGLRGVVASLDGQRLDGQRLDGQRLDGRRLDARRLAAVPGLPPAWERATELSVTLDGAALPGSPIQIRQIRRLDGYYACHEGGLLGWAWHPADPRRDPEIQLPTRRGAPARRFLLRERRPALPHVPLAEPRAILLSPAMLADAVRPWRLLGLDGAPLPGSSAVAPPAAPAQPPPSRLPGAARLALICVLSADQPALPTVPEEIDRLILVLSGVKLAGPVPPGAVVIRQRHDLGLGAAVRVGLAASRDHDVLVLPPGARLAAGMVRPLRVAVWSAPDIASAAPLALAGHGPAPAGLDQPVTMAEACWSPCLYLRHDAVAAVTVRAPLFGQGGGEDRDMTRRLTLAGWRHLMLPSLAMTPVEPPLSPGRQVVRARNMGWLKGAASPASTLRDPTASTLHDPTIPVLRAWAEQGWRGGRQAAGAVVLVTHGRGGGVARLVAHRAAALAQQGLRAILLHPARLPNGQTGCAVSAHGEPADPALVYAMPQEFPALAHLLASDAPRHLEWHHRLDHHPILALLADHLGVPTDIWQHDYACFCPRISLLGVSRRYCGEPTDPADCIACVAALGSLLSEPIDIVSLGERSRVEFARARDVFVASGDVATRLRRHFPGLAPRIASWDNVVPTAGTRPSPAHPRAARSRICVIGALGAEKGLDVLLACARDAAARDLALEFILLGHSEDDAALLATGRVWISGMFAETELASLIAAQHAEFAFVPSIVPETWCYALSSLWQAGLAVAVFDIGAQSQRIRDAGAGTGWVLPLGLSAAAINSIFLKIVSQNVSALSPSAPRSAIATLQPGTPILPTFLDPRPRFLSHEGEQT